MHLRRLLSLVAFIGLSSGPLSAALFVSSFSDNQVLRYDETTGTALGVLVTSGSGGLDLPHRPRVGPDGLLYVSSGGNDSVLRYHATTGAFVDAFIPSGGGGTGSDALDYPVELIFRGSHLFVSSQLNDSVKRFDATTGAFLDSFVPGASGGLDGPSGMVFAANGDLLVVGRYSNLVHRYDGATGASLGSFGAGQLAQPFGIAVGADGTAYVANGDTNAIAQFNSATGVFLGNVTTTGSGLGFPIGVEVGPDNNLYAASYGTGVVKRFTLPGGGYLGDFAASALGATLNGPNYFTFASTAVAPAATTQPLAYSGTAGGAASFTAAFSGSPAPAIQWQVSTDAGSTWSDLVDGNGVSGAQSATVQFAFVSQTLQGAHVRAVATNAGGTASSASATLTVAAGTARLANVSARAFVGLGQQVLIPGTAVAGTGTRRLLVRAAGPTLGELGVDGVLADPVLEVRRSNGSLVASNDDWSSGTAQVTAQLVAETEQAGGFPLTTDSADAALVIELAAGTYTFVVSGKNDTTGIVLVEVYELP